jgi:hypothetical protein
MPAVLSGFGTTQVLSELIFQFSALIFCFSERKEKGKKEKRNCFLDIWCGSWQP